MASAAQNAAAQPPMGQASLGAQSATRRQAAAGYDEDSVVVLKGLQPVQNTPGMYTMTDSPTHICQEVIDNSVDEALAGFAKEISVTVFADGSLQCADDGRGIPVGPHPEEKISALEVVFTRLHAGGKFRKGDKNASYRFSGGLHGVGVSVTNALSLRLEATVRRDGGIWAAAFANGETTEPLRKIGSCPKSETGTTVRVWPDPKYFDSPQIDLGAIARSLRAKAVLLPGLVVKLAVEGRFGSGAAGEPADALGQAAANPARDPRDPLAPLNPPAPRAAAPWAAGGEATEGTANPPTQSGASGPERAAGAEAAEKGFALCVWHFPRGLAQYLADLIGARETLCPIVEGESYLSQDDEKYGLCQGEGAAFALTWLENGPSIRESYVNLIPTPLGGTHESGLKAAAFGAISRFIDFHGLAPRNVRLQSEDAFAKIAFVLSARSLNPQFQGQTKDKFTQRDAVRLIERCAGGIVEQWLNDHVEDGKRIAEAVIRQAMERIRSQKKVERRKGSQVAVLPGKLTDCESEDVRINELFLVEGDSAGGSAKMARDKRTQAILPLRGKVLNTYEVARDNLFSNQEIHDISVAIGLDPHGPGERPNMATLRYGKINIMSDADVDGEHIQVLLLTLFYKHFPQLIKEGRVGVCQPPLFRVDVSGMGKKKGPRKFYALDRRELDQILSKLKREKVNEKNITVSRFKGLGEMSPEQLRDTTMNPDTRRLLKAVAPEGGEGRTEGVFLKLMGKGEAARRRAWMEAEGDRAETDV